MMEILMTTAYNSRYAVCSRSPKPFATLSASHTRRTLGDISLGGYKYMKEVKIMG